MIYVDYNLLYGEPIHFIENLRMFMQEYPEVKYNEYLDLPYRSKYDYFRNGIDIGGAYLSIGKYRNYDKNSKTFDIFPMVRLRCNPNKLMLQDWFKHFLGFLLMNVTNGQLIKYDYAVDIPTEPKNVKVFNTRKEPGLCKGTRYYGQAGRNGYCKIYDKQKEMARYGIVEDALTRVEHTLFAKDSARLEEVFVLDNKTLKTDMSALNDTEKAIVDMYLTLKANGIEYDLHLGRKMNEKLKEYISGQYVLLEYGNYINVLLQNIYKTFRCSPSITDDDYILQDDEWLNPFD